MERSGDLDRGIDLKKAQAFAENLASEAGKLLLKDVGKIEVFKKKDRQDIATNVDLASEALIIQAIQNTYPDHNIFSEERGKVENKSDYTWIIDPLDGTKEYFRGIPLYTVAISLKYKNDSILGVVLKPAGNQLFSAIIGGGAFLNGRKVNLSLQDKLADSFVYCYLPRYDKEREKEFDKVWESLKRVSKAVYRLRSMPDLNLSCCWLAMGGCEAVINLYNPQKLWDVSAGFFIANEAGARITDSQGMTISDDCQSATIVTNGKIHKKLLEVLNES